MGNNNSTTSTKKNQQVHRISDNNNITKSRLTHDPELRHMRRTLKNDQEVFILNNLMLCVQFFENYEREILDIRSDTVSQKENDANTILAQSQKHVLLPGALAEQMSRHVKLRSTRITDCESTIEPLQSVGMNIILDNINVDRITEKHKNDLLPDQIVYNMNLEPSSNHGHVLLRFLDMIKPKKEEIVDSSEQDLPLIVEDEDEMNHEKEYIHINHDARFLSTTLNPSYTQSTSDLHDIDRINEEIDFVNKGRRHSVDASCQKSSCGINSHRKLNDKRLKVRSNTMQRKLSFENMSTSRRSSGYKSGSSKRSSMTESDSDCSYTTTTSSNTSKCSISRWNPSASSSEIPVSCFKKFICTPDGRVCKEKSKRKLAKKQGERRMRKVEELQAEERSYFRSDKFRRYFKDLFVNQLAGPLGFEIEDDADVIRQGATLHCYSIKILEGNSTLIIPYEIIPSIWARGRIERYSDLLQRLRQVLLDPAKDKMIWLTNEMLDKIEQLGYHIIPESYKPTRETNLYDAVEWKVTFPAAERYLETCLNHSQAHLYMMGLILRKTFIWSTDQNFQLTASHIRSQLFWFIEENDNSSLLWLENRSGEGLRELLKRLYTAVSQSQPCLADYFISKKNLFADIPRQYLHVIQKQIKRIIDNPIMYVTACLNNIRYRPDFFPVLDYKRLYNLLTIHDMDLLAYIRPDLSHVDRPVPKQYENELETRGGQYDGIGEYGEGKTKPKENQKTFSHNSKNMLQELVVEITDECAELQGIRLTAVLNMFICHFMKMAEHCYQYGAMKQKDIYLNQAQRLSIILQDQVYGKEDAERYLDALDALRDKLSPLKIQEDLPRIDNPIISIPLNQYFIDESNK